MAEIQKGEFFIVGGQIAYVAEVGEEFTTQYERRDGRLRVICDNATESDFSSARSSGRFTVMMPEGA